MRSTAHSKPILDEHTAAHVAELFRAFSDTSRVRILFVLTTPGIECKRAGRNGRDQRVRPSRIICEA